MSTRTDLQRDKCNILPRDIITYDSSIIQWNYPLSPFSNDYFYPCQYFPPQMHLSEILRLHVQVRAVGSNKDNVTDRNENLIDLDRPWQTLRCRLVTSRPATDILQVVLRSVTFRHVLLRSPRSTTAHLSRSIPPWLPWQIFWLFKNLSRRSRQPRRATFVDPVPLRCDTVTPFRPRWPKSWLPWSPGT